MLQNSPMLLRKSPVVPRSPIKLHKSPVCYKRALGQVTIEPYVTKEPYESYKRALFRLQRSPLIYLSLFLSLSLSLYFFYTHKINVVVRCLKRNARQYLSSTSKRLRNTTIFASLPLSCILETTTVIKENNFGRETEASLELFDRATCGDCTIPFSCKLPSSFCSAASLTIGRPSYI